MAGPKLEVEIQAMQAEVQDEHLVAGFSWAGAITMPTAHARTDLMQPVYPCPTCHERTISMWRKFHSASHRPAVCRNCRGLSYVSGWAHLFTSFGLEFLSLAAVLLALTLKSWWGLLLLPVGFVAMASLVGIGFSLKATDAESVAKARRLVAVQLVVAFAVILALAWLFSAK